MIEYELIVRPNAFGFGKDWTIVLTKGNVKKSFWLGQDVKVVNRMLGMNMIDATKYYSNKAGSNNFEVIAPFIASDILRKIADTQRLDQDKLEQIFNMNSWELCVE